jgi:serine O-acetyltransferase
MSKTRFDAPNRALPFWTNVGADIRAHVSPELYPKRTLGWLPIAIKVALTSSGFRAVLNYRFSHLARSRGGPIGSPASKLCFWIGRHFYGCSIASTARLQGGLVLPHPQGIVIGGDTEVGPGSWIFQNVTLGGTNGRNGMPHIGAGARIFTGAVIAGPVVIGDRVEVGANAVVTQDVPSDSRVRAPRSTVTP